MQANPMNVIVAFIRPALLDHVLDAVGRISAFPGMTVSEARGFGVSPSQARDGRVRAEVPRFEPCLRLEVFCRPTELVAIVETIRKAAYTGEAGDGKIFAGPVTLAYRVRSGEWGEGAILPGHGPGAPTGRTEGP